ncbi:HepT-like ribonuclease domain-containing protein [Aphanothece sacrum]|uniref:DUF86 domain-containing protein n=1 Tax=Aphanothece sacrum FPU1 TaxID=1920663 RepID=A0A401IGE1_APHSA|nr:DUF86 domain-containing protein [Aphanothece sacrum]GBF80353.1 hypothetical protein AsFPU1_1754 [Aphanothece sacrum FPU1]GBF83760.1 hypothetical protein AsFPU3_0803 [Aphanothece sacrum FPU3]
MEKDKASILDALIFAQRILEFTSGMDEKMFANDLKTQAAVLYEISVLGEAMRRISPEFQQQYPEIPYSKIIGMRNKLVHDYHEINLQLVWLVIQINIPELVVNLTKIVPQQDS